VPVQTLSCVLLTTAATSLKALLRFALAPLCIWLWVTGCAQPTAEALLPASTQLAVHVRPKAIVLGQISAQELLSSTFWKLLSSQGEGAVRKGEHRFMLSDFWAFTLPEVPGHCFFLYKTPEDNQPASAGASMQSVQIVDKALTLTVFALNGTLSQEAKEYVRAYGEGRILPLQMPDALHNAYKAKSHLLVYTHKGHEKEDTTFVSGYSVSTINFANGVSRGEVRYFPDAKNRLYGLKLLADDLGLRPTEASATGSMLSLSLDKTALKNSLRYHKPWRSLSLMAGLMGLPLAALTQSAGRDLYAEINATGTLAIATIDEPKQTNLALMRMRRNGSLSGDKPPYEFMSQPDWSLQTRGGMLEIRQGQAPMLPKFVKCQDTGLWAKLDSAGIDKVAGVFNVRQYALVQRMLPYMSGVELNLSNLPDGTYRGTFTSTHTLRLADMLAMGKEPVQDFLGGE